MDDLPGPFRRVRLFRRKVRPAAKTVRPVLPAGSLFMPVNISANTLGVGEGSGLLKRRLIVFGVPAAVLLMVVFGVWTAARAQEPLRPKTIASGAYEYTFLFYKRAEPVNLAAGEGWQYGKQARVIVKPTSEPLFTDCAMLGKKWRLSFTVTMLGRQQLVCTTDGKAFLTIFPYGKAQHLFEVAYTNSPPTTMEVERIMASMQAALQ